MCDQIAKVKRPYGQPKEIAAKRIKDRAYERYHSNPEHYKMAMYKSKGMDLIKMREELSQTYSNIDFNTATARKHLPIIYRFMKEEQNIEGEE